MNGIVQFRKCTLSNEDLIAAVDTLTDAIYTTGRIPTRHIPARPNDDYDLLVGELLLRFSALLEPMAQNTTKEPVIDNERAKEGIIAIIKDCLRIDQNNQVPNYEIAETRLRMASRMIYRYLKSNSEPVIDWEWMKEEFTDDLTKYDSIDGWMMKAGSGPETILNWLENKFPNYIKVK